MAKTTIDRLKATAPNLNKIDNNILDMWIDDAFDEVINAGFPEQAQEKANRYLAAYFGNMNSHAKNNIQTKKLDVIQYTYFDNSDTTQDPYLVEYMRLYDQYVNDNQSYGIKFF